MVRPSVAGTSQFLLGRRIAVGSRRRWAAGQPTVDESKAAGRLLLLQLTPVSTPPVETTIPGASSASAGPAGADPTGQVRHRPAPSGLIPGRPVVAGPFDVLIRLVQRIRQSSGRTGGRTLVALHPRIRRRRRCRMRLLPQRSHGRMSGGGRRRCHGHYGR